LVYFILGILTVQALLPLIDSITAVIMTGLEALKGYFGIKVAEYNSQIRRLALEEDEPKRRPIGFTADQEDDDYE
jgi:hypothetical protein